MTKSHSRTLSLVLDKISATNVNFDVPPTFDMLGTALEVIIGNTEKMVTYISKDDLTDILDNVFAKYDIKIASGKQKVIKSTAKKSSKTSKVSKSAKVQDYSIDGEKFTFNGVMVTKGQTYKDQTKGGNKLHTVVVQVTEEQLEAWKEWRKA